VGIKMIVYRVRDKIGIIRTRLGLLGQDWDY
jgi:hypothetical protein